MIGAGDMVDALLADGDQNKDSKIDFDGEWDITTVVYILWCLFFEPEWSSRNRFCSKHVLISIYSEWIDMMKDIDC